MIYFPISLKILYVVTISVITLFLLSRCSVTVLVGIIDLSKSINYIEKIPIKYSYSWSYINITLPHYIR